MKLTDAEAQLRSAGVTLLDIQPRDDPSKPKDTVLEQTLPSHRHRVCHSGACPRRLHRPSDTPVPIHHTRCQGVH